MSEQSLRVEIFREILDNGYVPSLGVLITYFNERELLRHCVESVFLQPEPPDEIVIYDDASIYAAKDYLPADWPVKILVAPTNGGPSRGRNALLAAAKSEFIHFHDADDWFHSTWCREVRRRMAMPRVDAVFTEVSSFIDGKKQCEQVIGLEALAGGGGDLVSFFLLHAMLVPSGTYRRSVVQRLGGYRAELWQSEDFEFHVRMALSEIRCEWILDPLVNIRLRPESRSQNLPEVWNCRLQALRLLFLDLPPKYYPAMAEAAMGVGSKLFQIGERKGARQAFRFAKEIGLSDFRKKGLVYHRIAKLLGPEVAEWMGIAYRHLLPSPLRKWVQRRAA